MATLERVNFSRYYRQFASNYAFSKEGLLAIAIPMIITNLILDYSRAPGSSWLWFLIAFLGYLTVLAVAIPIGILLRKNNVHSGFYLPIYFFIGMCRGVTVFNLGRAFDVIPQSEFYYRLLGSGTFVMTMLALSANLVSNFDRAGKSIRELEMKRQSLENRLASMKIEISEQKSEIAGRVSGLLSPVIEDLISRLNAAKGSDIAKQVAALRNTVENVVRPMSHSVVNAPAVLSEPNFTLSEPGFIRKLNLDTKVPVGAMYLPFISSFLLTLVSLPATLALAGWARGLSTAAVMGATSYLFHRVSRYTLRNVVVGTYLAAMIHTLTHIGIGAVTIGFVALAYPDFLTEATPRILILVVVLGFAFFIGQARHLHLNQANDSLIEVNAELEKLNAQAKQELWVNRRRIATVLHGPVQAALYASAIRLAQTKRPSKKLIQEVNADLQEALGALTFEFKETLAVRNVLREIIDVWSGVCEIYKSIPKSVYDATKKNPNAAEALVEIVRESVSNAIKHGHATEIEISAKLLDGIIALQVINNGKLPSAKQASTGYGTRILDELALNWSLGSTKSGKAIFAAEIVATV